MLGGPLERLVGVVYDKGENSAERTTSRRTQPALSQHTGERGVNKMRKVKHQRMAKAAATLFVATAFVLPLGPCWMMGLDAGTAAFNFGSLLDSNQAFLGVFYPCGIADVQEVDVNGVPTGPIQFTEDDLMFDCPVRQVTAQ
jgi:hypothetical protein